MAGNIKLIIEKGKPKSIDGKQLIPNLVYYPNWSWEITPRDKNEGRIIVSPRYDELKQLLKDILCHELRVDIAIGRKSNFARYTKFFSPVFIEEAQRTITNFELPDIYKNCKRSDVNAKNRP